MSMGNTCSSVRKSWHSNLETARIGPRMTQAASTRLELRHNAWHIAGAGHHRHALRITHHTTYTPATLAPTRLVMRYR